MVVPVIFSCLIIFIIWLQYEKRKADKSSKKLSDDFWQTEYEANSIRRADITALDYITIPIDQLPMEDQDDLATNSYRDAILMLSKKQIINLTGLTNTDLKLKYGTANINKLMECDSNYTILVRTLQKWGDRLFSQGHLNEATTVLEFAVVCLTEVSDTYKLLATLYKEQMFPNKIDHLIEVLPNTNIRSKDTLIHFLSEIKNN